MSLGLLGVSLQEQPRTWFAFIAAKPYCWPTPGILSVRIPMSFSAELPSSHSDPSLYCFLGLFCPTCRTLHLSVLKLAIFVEVIIQPIRFSLCVFSSTVSISPPTLVSSTKLVRVHPILPSRSFVKTLNSPWGILLVAGCQFPFVFSYLKSA